jgi:hypothetical protein
MIIHNKGGGQQRQQQQQQGKPSAPPSHTTKSCKTVGGGHPWAFIGVSATALRLLTKHMQRGHKGPRLLGCCSSPCRHWCNLLLYSHMAQTPASKQASKLGGGACQSSSSVATACAPARFPSCHASPTGTHRLYTHKTGTPARQMYTNK